MDRDAPLRSQFTARRAGVLVVLVALASLLFGTGTAAAEGWLPGGPPTDDRTVSLARTGEEPVTPNWIDSGPVVPLLLISTAAMLAMGCALLWSRCRTAADL